MRLIAKIFSVLSIFMLCTQVESQQVTKENYKITEVNKASETILIDGLANEKDWSTQSWYSLDQLWLGEPYSDADFKGRYKLLWDEEALYLLAEIKDDILLDRFSNPLERWWDEDCLEIFIDENNSGGNHQFNHSAFAYHVDLNGNVVDVTPTQEGKLYNSHVISKRSSQGNTSIWEVKIFLFDDSYEDDSNQKAQQLSSDKKIGFALAYCDNDASENRENFIGSSDHPGFKQDLGWKDASVFETLILRDK